MLNKISSRFNKYTDSEITFANYKSGGSYTLKLLKNFIINSSLKTDNFSISILLNSEWLILVDLLLFAYKLIDLLPCTFPD